MTANDKKDIRQHEWIGYKLKDAGSQNKAIKFLKELYPNMKEEEVEMMVELNSKQELKELAEAHGMDKNQIKKLL
jgi:glycerophosphoryl diester phosphodiesterase